MKKVIFVLLGIAMLTGCKQEKQAENPLQHELDSLKAVNATQAQDLEEFMTLVDQVNEGFQMIKEAEGRIEVKDGNVEGGSKAQIAENMEFIRQTMEQNRNIINQLKQKLSTSSANLSSLSKQIEMLEQEMEAQKIQIAELQAQLEARDIIIAEQGQQIDNLNENVNTLTEENAQKSAVVASQDKELNKAWFVFGTKRELKEQYILDSGDVLKNSNFNKGYFTEIDIRSTKDIKLYSKSAKVLTSHPESSYQLTKDANGQYELHITNPSLFWSVSKYLVVQVK